MFFAYCFWLWALRESDAPLVLMREQVNGPPDSSKFPPQQIKECRPSNDERFSERKEDDPVDLWLWSYAV